MRYLVVVEKGPSSYGAYVPDLPGCVAAGESKEEVLSLIREAIALHLPLPPQAITSK
jgi:predicted RNase H-like HicB family nuclease